MAWTGRSKKERERERERKKTLIVVKRIEYSFDMIAICFLEKRMSHKEK